jgi:hypothetical protein
MKIQLCYSNFAVSFVLALALCGCVSSQTKLDESQKLNSVAVEKGFAKSSKDAVASEAKKCSVPDKLAWELKFSAAGPFVQQNDPSGVHAYGTYQVVCFKAPQDGKVKLKLSTTHQGGGYSKAYYVRPSYTLYTKELKPALDSKKLDLKQDPRTQDYQAEASAELSANQLYYLFVEADNRHPELAWSQYNNPGLGFAIQAAFPIEVRSSPYGVVKAEITSATEVMKK